MFQCMTDKILHALARVYGFWPMKYFLFPLSNVITMLGWMCIMFWTPWSSVLPGFSMSPVKNIKILQYTASQLKYFTRSSIKSSINSNCNIVNDAFYDGRNNYKRTLDIYYTESHQSLKPIIILFYSRNWWMLEFY